MKSARWRPGSELRDRGLRSLTEALSRVGTCRCEAVGRVLPVAGYPQFLGSNPQPRLPVTAHPLAMQFRPGCAYYTWQQPMTDRPEEGCRTSSRQVPRPITPSFVHRQARVLNKATRLDGAGSFRVVRQAVEAGRPTQRSSPTAPCWLALTSSPTDDENRIVEQRRELAWQDGGRRSSMVVAGRGLWRSRSGVWARDWVR